ncbi:MAG: hypothetical protein BM485_16110 [Desulfobulbaceae bacterium DB1]|nr:MAG: hypothetical protein BM485_16110 [Desulfobulbaceae bacterium DB1]
MFYLFAGQAFADDKTPPELKMNDISGVLKEAQKNAQKLQLPNNDQGDTCGCQEKAGKVMEKFNSPDFKAKIRDEQQRLQETIFKDILTESLPQGDQNSPAETEANEEGIYLFVSSSVPLSTLRNYAAMIDRARTGQVIMVLRGFVGGMKKIRPTMEFIAEIMKKDSTCDITKEKCNSYQVNIQVDPQLFQRFGIEEVPALAYLPISVGKEEVKQAEQIIITGDASLDYLLERINREAKSADLNTLIAALRGGIGNGE